MATTTGKKRGERNRPQAPGAGADLRALWPSPDPERSVPLLQALHILTREGTLNQDSRRKLKQVLHLAQLLKPALEAALAEKDDPLLADCGAGKSYLGFILYDLVFGPAGRGRVFGIDARAELSDKARDIAAVCGFTRMEFRQAAIGEVQLDEPVDIVTALHACDTATDNAILFALRHGARHVALVPCCQAEVARLLEHCHGPLQQLWRHPIQRRELGAHITNIVRGLFLESHGYKVRVTELVGWEHSLKNEVILAERHQRTNPMAKHELEALLAQLAVRPALVDAAV